MAATKIEVMGLKQFQAALRAIDKDLPKQLRLANKEGADIVAEATQSSFSSRGGVAPKVAASVKSQAQQRSASVKIGGNRFPYALGSNFGSIRYKQFPPPVKPDYSLYRSIEAEREKVVEVYGDAMDRLAAKAFPS